MCWISGDFCMMRVLMTTFINPWWFWIVAYLLQKLLFGFSVFSAPADRRNFFLSLWWSIFSCCRVSSFLCFLSRKVISIFPAAVPDCLIIPELKWDASWPWYSRWNNPWTSGIISAKSIIGLTQTLCLRDKLTS